jgi:hypothetical protein
MQPQNKHFEEKLLAEKSLLEEELGRVGRKNPLILIVLLMI